MTTILLANFMAPYVAWGIGGDSDISLPFSMLATLLAAFLERPFTRWAGFQDYALIYSIRANILSWALGVLIVYASIPLDPRGFVFDNLVMLAIPFSIAVEGSYLSFAKRRQGDRLHWTPVVIGNIFSGLLLGFLSPIGSEWGLRLQIARAPIIDFLGRYQLAISNTVLYFCIATFIVVMFVPVRSHRARKTDDSVNDAGGGEPTAGEETPS